MKMTCHECGFEGEGNFCTKCGAPLQPVEKSMKEPDLINVGVASFVIGVVGSVIGGFFTMFLAVFAPSSEDFPYVIASGFVSGFFICFLGSILFLSMMWNRGDKAIRRVGGLFGAVAGALSASISVMFIDSVICPGCLSGGEDASLSLLGIFGCGIPGAVIGVIAALIITYFPGMVLLKYVNKQSLKPTKSDSAPTEKK